MREEQIRNLVNGWYNKARLERNSISRFVFLWFCFNAWLAYESDEDRDRDMLEWLKHSDQATSQLRAAYDFASRSSTFRRDLSSLAALSPIGRTGRRDGEFVHIASPDDFAAVLEGIYVVRCNLFHGGKTAGDLRDEKLVRACGSILRKWIGNLTSGWQRTA